MSELPRAPAAAQSPVAAGTRVELEPGARLIDDRLVAGGAPWRLLALAGASRDVVHRWAHGDVVRRGEEALARTLVDRGLALARPAHVLGRDDVDVLIPVHDDVEALAALLGRLEGWYVTVVDDASRDPHTVTEVARRAGATVVRLDDRRGPAGARNAGLAATTRAFVWFLDADLELDEPASILARLGAHLGDPRVAAAAPRVRGGRGRRGRDRFERRFGALDQGATSALVTPSGPVPFVPSACLLARRSALGSGFDPTLHVGEDVDLVWRLGDGGWLVRYDADVTVAHPARTTWRAWWAQREGYGRSAAALASRHGSRLAPLRVDPWTAVTWAGVITGRPLLGVRLLRTVRDAAAQRLVGRTSHPARVASAVVLGATARSGPALARATVRTYGPWLGVAALLAPRRGRLLAVAALGVAGRWRRRRVDPRDVPIALLDDLAYALGVARGALHARSLAALTPRLTASSLSWRDVLGLSRATSDL
ncbi:MAG: mycofactocin biosynthesis glycosyltransferase MftF [Acidimicrobiales bacterium]